jgi:hypothetical protein
MGNETPYEDISRGNQWFVNGLRNMSMIKVQAEYSPLKSKHNFRLGAHFLDEVKDHVDNNVAHHLAGNVNGVIPAGFNLDNSAYDRFNSIGVADPKMLILNFEYRYQLTKNSRIRVGFIDCSFNGDAVKQTVLTNAIKAGEGRFGDYDYNLFWVEIYNRF